MLPIGVCFVGGGCRGVGDGTDILGIFSRPESCTGAEEGAGTVAFAGGSIFANGGLGAGEAALEPGSIVLAAWKNSPTIPSLGFVGDGGAGFGGVLASIGDDGACGTGAPIGVGICGALSASSVGRQLPGGAGGGGFFGAGVGKIGSGFKYGLKSRGL